MMSIRNLLSFVKRGTTILSPVITNPSMSVKTFSNSGIPLRIYSNNVTSVTRKLGVPNCGIAACGPMMCQPSRLFHSILKVDRPLLSGLVLPVRNLSHFANRDKVRLGVGTLTFAGLGLGALGFGYLYFEQKRNEGRTWTEAASFDQIFMWVQDQFGWNSNPLTSTKLGNKEGQFQTARTDFTKPVYAENNPDEHMETKKEPDSKADVYEVTNVVEQLEEVNAVEPEEVNVVEPEEVSVDKVISEVEETLNDLKAESVDPILLARKIEEVEEAFEKDLLKSLRRQAQVYQENLDGVKSELKADYERRVQQLRSISEAEHLVDIRAKYSQATAALAGMEVTLKGRVQEEAHAESFRKLWNVCNSLYQRINYTGAFASPQCGEYIEIDKRSLLKEFEFDAFVVQLLDCIPERVDSVESLRERFFDRVDKACRKVSLLKTGESFSIVKYLLGSIQASLITNCDGVKSIARPKDIFGILDLVGVHLREGDFMEALCALNRSEGMAREVCRDWMRDARALLETNQILYALMTHASASNIRA